MSTALTEVQRRKLNDLETIIEKGLQTFVEVGASLAMIREQKLYAAEHETFEAYVEKRWGWTASRARQLIGAADAVQSIESVTTVTLPATEGVARELVPVPAEKRPEVWETATRAAEAEGKKPTAKHVREAGQPFRPKMPAPTKPKSKVDLLREQREQQAAEREPVPDEKRTKPRPNVAHVMAVVDAATSLGEVTDEQIEALPYNDFMGERLRVAREVIDRILRHHRRETA